jgi:hypothetical protein
MHEFQPSQSDGRRPIGLEAQHGAASALDRPMILLHDIVQVLALAYQRPLEEFLGLLAAFSIEAIDANP